MKSRIVAKNPLKTNATSKVRAIADSNTIVVILRFSSNIMLHCFLGPIKKNVLDVIS